MQQQEAVEEGGYRSRSLGKALLAREMELSGDTAAGGYRSGRVLKYGTQQQEAIEVGGYRSMSLEEAVLERQLSGDTAAGGYTSRRL